MQLERISQLLISMLEPFKRKGNGILWSREKHIPMVKLAEQHGLDAFIFDVYFIENSERKLEYKVLSNISDSVLNIDQLKDLFPDPDNDLADAAKKAGNIIFAQSFKPQPKNKEPVKQRSEIMDRRLKLLEEKNYFEELIVMNIQPYLIFTILKQQLIP